MNNKYNPDVLTCLANLSNDEVFTPPQLVNQILDLLPEDIYEDKNIRFLDPVCKSGVFLREIARRLMIGLENGIPDQQTRINHIFKNQLFGIAITEMTSLLSRRSVYCSKTANGKYSVCETFADLQGNIRFERVEHTWYKEQCVFCGANKGQYDRGGELESHAYQFIHVVNPEELFNMKFDVIVGNPPYQLSDGGFGTSATPIYHKFVKIAKKLNPRYLSMIIPARWYSGGKGLDEFRDEMLKDHRIRQIVDFPEAIDCFPGVQIKGGVCYFLWDRDNPGNCKVATSRKGEIVSEMTRALLEENCETFIRYNEAISILSKVRKFKEESLAYQVSSRKPFGLSTLFKAPGKNIKSGIKLYQNGGVGFMERSLITKNIELIDRYKVLIPRAGSGSDTFPHSILGKPFVGPPGSACTETYIVIGDYDNPEECHNLCTYVSTLFFRFLVLLTKSTQDAAAKVYTFVPMQNLNEPWTDEKLYQKYGLTKEEIAFIESMIRPMELDNE
jgi:site-specific DNA-methyltransferase (adenine-specific)